MMRRSKDCMVILSVVTIALVIPPIAGQAHLEPDGDSSIGRTREKRDPRKDEKTRLSDDLARYRTQFAELYPEKAELNNTPVSLPEEGRVECGHFTKHHEHRFELSGGHVRVAMDDEKCQNVCAKEAWCVAFQLSAHLDQMCIHHEKRGKLVKDERYDTYVRKACPARSLAESEDNAVVFEDDADSEEEEIPFDFKSSDRETKKFPYALDSLTYVFIAFIICLTLVLVAAIGFLVALRKKSRALELHDKQSSMVQLPSMGYSAVKQY